MELEEIMEAVRSGKTVCWSNDYYRVIENKMNGEFLIKCGNGHCIGLASGDRKLNGKAADFYIKK